MVVPCLLIIVAAASWMLTDTASPRAFESVLMPVVCGIAVLLLVLWIWLKLLPMPWQRRERGGRDSGWGISGWFDWWD